MQLVCGNSKKHGGEEWGWEVVRISMFHRSLKLQYGIYRGLERGERANQDVAPVRSNDDPASQRE
jgi:hypothetical protein